VTSTADAVTPTGSGSSIPVGDGGTVPGESNYSPEDLGRAPTPGARTLPGEGRSFLKNELQHTGSGSHPTPMD